MKKLLTPLMIMFPLLIICVGCRDGANPDGVGQPDGMAMNANGVDSPSGVDQITTNRLTDFRTTINFENDSTTWKEVVKEAKKESKPIFLYGWAAWCQPCQYENNNILGRDVALAQFLNENFINTRYMMETITTQRVSEAWDIVDKYKIDVTAYPIYLFFDANGKLVYQSVGFVSASDLLAMAEAASILGNKDKIK